MKQEGIPASVGYIQKIFKQHRIPRLARRSVEQRSPRVIPADRTKLDLREQTFDTEYAGLFLFAFGLAQMDLKTMLDQFKILREQWFNEPSVHGGKTSRLKS